MPGTRVVKNGLWIILAALVLIAGVALVSAEWWRDYLFPPRARDFGEMADVARPASWAAEDGFMRTDFERRPVLGRLSELVGFHLTATTQMLTDVRISGVRLVVVDEADRDVVVAEASVRQGRLSGPQRFVSVTGLIPAQHRGWYLELLASTWDEYQVTYSVGDVGDRMPR